MNYKRASNIIRISSVCPADAVVRLSHRPRMKMKTPVKFGAQSVLVSTEAVRRQQNNTILHSLASFIRVNCTSAALAVSIKWRSVIADELTPTCRFIAWRARSRTEKRRRPSSEKRNNCKTTISPECRKNYSKKQKLQCRKNSDWFKTSNPRTWKISPRLKKISTQKLSDLPMSTSMLKQTQTSRRGNKEKSTKSFWFISLWTLLKIWSRKVWNLCLKLTSPSFTGNWQNSSTQTRIAIPLPRKPSNGFSQQWKLSRPKSLHTFPTQPIILTLRMLEMEVDALPQARTSPSERIGASKTEASLLSGYNRTLPT